MQWKVEFYQLANGSSPPLDWFSEQEDKVQAKFTRIFDLLRKHGISVGMPYVRPIKDSKLFEIRVEQKTNIYRVCYFAYTGRRFILLHGFQKKTQKTPAKEIEIAESRRAEFLARENKQLPNTDTGSQSKRKKK